MSMAGPRALRATPILAPARSPLINLKTNMGVQAARMVEDPVNGVAVQLETANAIVMLCTPR